MPDFPNKMTVLVFRAEMLHRFTTMELAETLALLEEIAAELPKTRDLIMGELNRRQKHPKSRSETSERMRKAWRNPQTRAKMLSGMKKKAASKRLRKAVNTSNE